MRRAMRRRVGALSALLALAGATLAVLAAPAGAQTGYPPPGCTANASTQQLGSFNVGDTITLTLAPSCPFQPGTPVTVTVNGVAIGTKVANSSGFVVVRITVVSTSTLSVDDPVLVPVVCGQNVVTATGFSAVANATVTQSAVFTVNCGPAATTPVPAANNTNNNVNTNLNNNTNTVNVGGDTININAGGGGPIVVPVPGGGRGPGRGPGREGGGQDQNQSQRQSQEQSQFQRIVQQLPGPPAVPQPGRIAFTGTNIIGMSLLALTALLIGGFLVSSVKRRRQGAPVEEAQEAEAFEPELTLS